MKTLKIRELSSLPKSTHLISLFSLNYLILGWLLNFVDQTECMAFPKSCQQEWEPYLIVVIKQPKKLSFNGGNVMAKQETHIGGDSQIG